MQDQEKIETSLDIGEATTDSPLNTPDFHSRVDEILGDVVDLIQTQGATDDEQVRSVIDDYIVQQWGRGELDDDGDMSSDDLRKQVFEAWKLRREEFLYEQPHDNV